MQFNVFSIIQSFSLLFIHDAVVFACSQISSKWIGFIAEEFIQKCRHIEFHWIRHKHLFSSAMRTCGRLSNGTLMIAAFPFWLIVLATVSTNAIKNMLLSLTLNIQPAHRIYGQTRTLWFICLVPSRCWRQNGMMNERNENKISLCVAVLCFVFEDIESTRMHLMCTHETFCGRFVYISIAHFTLMWVHQANTRKTAGKWQNTMTAAGETKLLENKYRRNIRLLVLYRSQLRLC